MRGLATGLNVSKPVVTRALNRLGALGYLRRQRDDTDKRNIFVARTPRGAAFLEEFGQFIGDSEGGRRVQARHFRARRTPARPGLTPRTPQRIRAGPSR